MDADSLHWARVIRPKRQLTYVALPERDRVVAEALRAVRDSPGSCAIVGPAGAGKGVVAHEIGRRLAADGWTAFAASAGEMIAGLKYIGEIEERLQQIQRADGRTAWLLPDLVVAVSAGTYSENPHGLVDRLLPLLEHGRIRLLAPCEPAEWAMAVQARPALRALVAPIQLEPASREGTLRIADARLEELGTRASPELLDEALALAREHLAAVAAPGHLLRLLTAAARRLGGADGPPRALDRDALLPALSELTGLPEDLLDERRALDLGAVERFFSERVLGQPEAVRLLVERIALIKSGLTDPTRPLGVFMFTGPTGTGKTELAKSLAHYLFGSPDRLVRVDMSEMQSASDLERLIGGPTVDSGDSITAAIRRQPFSVVLLDEFEKAHPRAWDLFLQVFDDGRLTDQTGATADFRHAVVIMTANVGAGTAAATSIGFAPAPAGAAATGVQRAVAELFRPEFLNRIDRVVAFSPLSRDIMRGLVAKELRDVLQRRGLRTRPWAVEWDDSAIEVLLRNGFSPTLGARPLKRAVEQQVLTPLARAIVEQTVPEGDQFLLVRSTDGRRVDVRFIDPDLEVALPAVDGAVPRDPRAIALDPRAGDEDVLALSDALDRLSGRIAAPAWGRAKSEALQAMAVAGFWERPDRFAVLAEAEQRDRIQAALETARSLLARLVRARAGRGRPHRLAHLLAQRLFLLDVALDALEAGEPPDAFVLVQPLEGAAAFGEEVAGMYRRWAERRGMRLEAYDAGPGASALLEIGGLGAHRLLVPESGLHVLERPSGKRTFARQAVRVTVAPQPVAPAAATRPARRRHALDALAAQPAAASVTRRYRREPAPLVRDGARGWRTGRIDRVLDGDFDLIVDEP